MKIEMKPAPRSNPEGRLDLPWNIFQDGKCTNTCPNRDAAEQAIHRLQKRFPEAVVDKGNWTARTEPVVEEPAERPFGEPEPVTFRSGVTGEPIPKYLQVQRPRGAPELGAVVREQWVSPSNGQITEHTGRVVAYLSEGFTVECTREDGSTYVRNLLVKGGDWQVVK